MLALDGIKVLDLSRVLAGPWCTQTLADLGAEVWKIESPQEGDDTRTWTPPDVGGELTYYLAANRNKKSIAVNIKSAEGQAIIHRLMERADVLVENMRAGTLDKLGLGYAAARAINPRLVYCSISAYGRTSPLADRPGYDFLIQAESGLMSITGWPDGEPTRHGMAITDLVTGMNTAQAVLAALFARERTGEGQFIDMALFDSAVALLANIGSSYINVGLRPRRYGNAHPTIVPYQLFDTADGQLALAVGNNLQFRNLCREVLGRPEIAEDERFRRSHDRVANREVLVPILAEAFAKRGTAEWIALLNKAGVPAGRVRELHEVFASPEAEARGLARRVPHPTAGEVALLASPLRLEGTPVREPTAPPLLGQHTAEVLETVLGANSRQIEDWAAAGVIGLYSERAKEGAAASA